MTPFDWKRASQGNIPRLCVAAEGLMQFSVPTRVELDDAILCSRAFEERLAHLDVTSDFAFSSRNVI